MAESQSSQPGRTTEMSSSNPSTHIQTSTEHDGPTVTKQDSATSLSSSTTADDAQPDASEKTREAVPNEDKRPPLDRQTSRADDFSKLRITIIMFSLCAALFLSALDVTIITTALPTIAAEFKASNSGYTWVGSAYLLANAGSTPLWGKFSDIWGRKILLVIANVVFMVGSLIAGISKSINMLIAGRVVQGLGGGGLIILVSICIADLFSMRDRPKAYALVGLTWVSGYV